MDKKIFKGIHQMRNDYTRGSPAWEREDCGEGVQDHEQKETPRIHSFFLFPFQILGASNGMVSGSNEG